MAASVIRFSCTSVRASMWVLKGGVAGRLLAKGGPGAPDFLGEESPREKWRLFIHQIAESASLLSPSLPSSLPSFSFLLSVSNFLFPYYYVALTAAIILLL